MAGHKIMTDLEPPKALRTAWRAAQDQGFALTPAPLPEDAHDFTAHKGSRWLNMLGGNLFTPHCRFKVSVERYDRGTEVVLETASAATVMTGAIGARRIGRQAAELADAVAQALQADGGRIIERKEY